MRAQRYFALDLFDWLEALGRERAGTGPFLTLSNARGEQAVFRVAEIRPLAPRLVIGIDDERNLFRIVDLYHTLREYSWRGEGPRFLSMARPLGAFLLFPAEEPKALGSRVFGRYALTPESFRLGEADPWRVVRDLPVELESALTRDLACVACHQLRGAGGRAGHPGAPTRPGRRIRPPARGVPGRVWRATCSSRSASPPRSRRPSRWRGRDRKADCLDSRA